MERRARGHEEGWLLSYADLITNLLIFFVMLLTAAHISRMKMKQITGGSAFASNWELSSARAIVVRQRLEDVGIDRTRIRVEGYADTKPLPESVLAGLDAEQRLARHRRVVVRIY